MAAYSAGHNGDFTETNIAAGPLGEAQLRNAETALAKLNGLSEAKARSESLLSMRSERRAQSARHWQRTLAGARSAKMRRNFCCPSRARSGPISRRRSRSRAPRRGRRGPMAHNFDVGDVEIPDTTGLQDAFVTRTPFEDAG